MIIFILFLLFIVITTISLKKKDKKVGMIICFEIILK